MSLHMTDKPSLYYIHARTQLWEAAPIRNTMGLIAESKEKWVENMVVLELYLTIDTYHLYS